MSRRSRQGWFGTLGVLALGIACSLAGAQDLDLLQQQTEVVHSQQMPRDYRVLSVLSQVERGLASGTQNDFELLAEQIQQLLDQPFDYFLLKNLLVDVGLRTRIDQLMREAPQDFRELYDRQFRSEARELMDSAVRAGDQEALRDLIRRYAWTSTGRQAMELLANSYADQGEPARAARMLDTLLSYPDVLGARPELAVASAQFWRQAGQDDASRAALSALKRQFGSSVVLQGKTIPLFGDEQEALGWLAQQAGRETPLLRPATQASWLLPRGSESGVASAGLSSPLSGGAWEAPLLDGFDIDPIFPQEAKVQENLRELLRTMDEREKKFIDANHLKKPLAPAGLPLRIGRTVVVSGPGSIKAYDAETGKFLWTTVEVDNTFQTLNRLANQASNPLVYRRLVDAFFAQRMWLNRTAGQLTSDGAYVYAVIDTGLMIAPRAMPFGPVVARSAPAQRSDNRLVAFELATDGTIRWSMGGRLPPQNAAPQNPGGAPGGGDPGQLSGELPGLMGVYFLGPPLPADGVLYVLGEDRGQVKLFALDPRPKTPRGEVLWSLPLLNPTGNSYLLDNVGRRMGAMTPVLEGGILVCEMLDGVVTAIDPTQRRVLWSRRYRPADPPLSRNMFIMQAMNAAQQGEEVVVEEQLGAIGWWDTNPTLAGDAVLLTPADDDRLHAFRLSTGEDLWEPVPRGEGLYIASATKDQFLVVEHRAVESRSIATGKVLWRRPLEAPGVRGRGLCQGDRLTLPLGTGDLVTLDIHTGQILAQSPMPSKVRSANVIAADGQIVLQTATRLFGYPSLARLTKEIAARLAQDPEDPKALSERGSLHLHQGEFAEGQADLRKALVRKDIPAARRLLVWSLLADLRRDFDKARGTLDELNRMATDSDQKFWLHLTTAEGLQRAGDETGALREYFRIPVSPGTEDLESGLTVSRSRWVLGKVEDLRRASRDPAALAKAIQEVLDEVAKGRDPSAIATVVQRFGLQRGVEKAILSRPEPPERQAAQRRVEQDLWWVMRHGDASFHPAAAARIAPMRLRAGASEPVTDLLEALAGRWGETPVRDGVLGRDLLKQWIEDPALSGPLQVRPQWGEARIEVDPPTDSAVGRPFSSILVRGPTAGPLDGASFHFQDSGQKLTARDRFGSDSRLDVSTQMEDRPSGVGPAQYINTVGRLLVYVSMDEFQIVDTATNHTIVRELLTERSQLQSFGSPRGRSMMPDEHLQDGIRGMLVPGMNPGSFAGNVGQPTFTSICYQRGEQLFCIDPASGELHWSRSEIPEGCEILMDDDFTVLCPPLTQELVLFRTADGRHVGRASVPKDVVRSRRGAEWGRLLLTATPAETKVTYGMFDPALPNPPAGRPAAKADSEPTAKVETDGETADTSGGLRWSRDFPAGTEWTSADGENIAFLSPAGKLEIVQFETGRTLFEATLSAIPNLDGFLLRRDGGRYTVLTWLYGNAAVQGRIQKSDPRHREVIPQRQFRRFESFERIGFSGPLFLIDETGKTLWHRPAPKFRSLLVSNTVPARWPVLAITEEHESPGEGTSSGWSWSVEIVDIRTGQSLRKETSQERLQGKDFFPWRTDALNRLSLGYSGKTFAIRLMNPTGKEPAGTGDEAKAAKTPPATPTPSPGPAPAKPEPPPKEEGPLREI